jgi:hypothetical protein
LLFFFLGVSAFLAAISATSGFATGAAAAAAAGTIDSFLSSPSESLSLSLLSDDEMLRAVVAFLFGTNFLPITTPGCKLSEGREAAAAAAVEGRTFLLAAAVRARPAVLLVMSTSESAYNSVAKK